MGRTFGGLKGKILGTSKGGGGLIRHGHRGCVLEDWGEVLLTLGFVGTGLILDLMLRGRLGGM